MTPAPQPSLHAAFCRWSRRTAPSRARWPLLDRIARHLLVLETVPAPHPDLLAAARADFCAFVALHVASGVNPGAEAAY